MKVLLATPSYYPVVGGSETLAWTLSLKLNEMGVHADVMTLNMEKKWNPIWKEETTDNGVFKVFKVPAINPFASFKINPLYSLLGMNVIPKLDFTKKLEEYDVIHFLGEADLSFPIFSYFVKKPKLMHCVAVYRLLGYYRKRAPLRKIIKKLFPRVADLYVVDHEDEKKILTHLDIPASKILTLPIGVDIQTFSPNEKLKLDNLILFVGRIERVKGLHILVEALSYLEIPAEIIIIGPKWEETYVEEMERMCNAVNRKGVHKVKLLGTMDRNSLVTWYQKATVVVCPYLIEPYSNITREALASGTPVVSTGTHILKRGSDGILVTSKDPKKLAHAMTKLLKDKEMRVKYGKQGRKTVEQHLSLMPITKNLTKVYNSMLDF